MYCLGWRLISYTTKAMKVIHCSADICRGTRAPARRIDRDHGLQQTLSAGKLGSTGPHVAHHAKTTIRSMKFDDIVPILQRLQDPGPLDPNPADSQAAKEFKELYIKDLHASHGDLAKKLALEIKTSSGTRHGYLFSGTIGSGKSTELRRLA